MKKQVLKMVVVCILILSFLFSTVSALAASFPYPELRDYTDLNRSFQTVAAEKILPEYRDYVLNSIKYHIESPTDSYQVAKALLNERGKAVDGNALFFFDGVSTNLAGATYTQSGYLKNGNRYNTSAVCVVVRVNSSGRPVIVYAAEGSTIPDNVRNAALNEGLAVPITVDGIYNFQTYNHKGYAAFNIGVTDGSALRCSGTGTGSRAIKKATYVSKGDGIDIHTRASRFANTALSNTDTSSNGCFIVGKHSTRYDYTEYNEFIKVTTGFSPARSLTSDTGYAYKTPTAYGYKLSYCAGVVIIDRSNYYEALKIIYGNDSDYGISGGYSAARIASAIVAGSQTWHSAVAGMAPSTYKVSYNANGGTGTMAFQNYKVGETATVSPSEPVREGWRFLGWAETKSAAKVKYKAGDVLPGGNDITLYAVWRLKGDLDGDNVITIADVGLLFRWWNGKKDLERTLILDADRNGDGVTDLIDAALLFEYISG